MRPHSRVRAFAESRRYSSSHSEIWPVITGRSFTIRCHLPDHAFGVAIRSNGHGRVKKPAPEAVLPTASATRAALGRGNHEAPVVVSCGRHSFGYRSGLNRHCALV